MFHDALRKPGWCVLCALLLLSASCSDKPQAQSSAKSNPESTAKPVTHTESHPEPPAKPAAQTDTAAKSAAVSGATTKASPSSQTPKTYFISPANGDTVATNFRVVFGLTSMGVAPAGVVKENTGHHHLLIDVDELPPMDRPLPSTDNIRHFGGGQTETWVQLKPGKHKLQLLLGDFAHIPHSTPLLSEPIVVTVSDGSQ